MSWKEWLQSPTDCTVRAVEIPRMGTVYLRSWSVRERLNYLDEVNEARTDEDARIRLLTLSAARSVCDKDGRREFSDDEADQFLNLSPDTLVAIKNAVDELNEFNWVKDEPDEAKPDEPDKPDEAPPKNE